ncbi:TetR/AcrR family transcriptional regulator [Cereibacter sphaeroides]|uniref:TetR/AcrR family transcriptional regulator n=1 Tax=Cereibacter sphaeroides TaxID=1063 RepID=UPI001F17D998|nr:TetR/AcrR family transcriptional regulator [Cereibacter sphaeroides]MCE6953051.1 TetR/AcrR family transcriptional regulator [Cereibacter sphaeroides]
MVERAAPATRPDQTPRFRRRAEARPDEVLDAALDLFSRKGFAGTTVEQIARHAGLSKAAVYLYFPSKQALLTGLVRRAIVPLADEALARISCHRGDPRPVIRQLAGLLAERLADPKVFAVPSLVLREAASAPEVAAMYRAEVLEKVLPALRGLIAQGVEGGHVRPVDPDLAVRSIVGPIFVHLLLSHVFGIGEPRLDALLETHLAILCAGLEPERAP